MPSERAGGRLVAAGLAVLLLLIGAAAGIAADRWLLPPRRGPGGGERQMPKVFVERLTRDLKLTEAQQREVTVIAEARWKALAEVFQRVDPEIEAIRKQADVQIRALLQPEQQQRFDEIVADFEKRRAEMRARFGTSAPPPPPPDREP